MCLTRADVRSSDFLTNRYANGWRTRGYYALGRDAALGVRKLAGDLLEFSGGQELPLDGLVRRLDRLLCFGDSALEGKGHGGETGWRRASGNCFLWVLIVSFPVRAFSG